MTAGYKKHLGKRFLLTLIPDTWEETVYENHQHFACEVIGSRMELYSWNIIYKNIMDAFCENLIEVYQLAENGAHFIVFLKLAQQW